jgi:hypothetical protein
MPTYTYCCERCNRFFTIATDRSKYKSKEKCHYCGSSEQVFRDYRADNVYSVVRLSLEEITKVGHYAERQTEMKGKYELESMKQDFTTKKDPESALPPGMSRLSKDDYVNMPSKETKKGKRDG